MIKKQTIEYKIVSLIGLAGEMQTEELYKLKYGKEYIRKTISKLITKKYIKVYKFENKKYLRLTVACKRYLRENHSDRFENMFDGASRTNKVRTAENRRIRNHRLSELLILLDLADVKIFADEKSLMDKTHGFERTDGTDPADYCAEKSTAEFYTSDELKAAGLFKNARTSRAMGVIFSYPDVYIVYNFADEVLEMEYKTEETFLYRTGNTFYGELQGKHCYEYAKVIFVGNSMNLINKMLKARKGAVKKIFHSHNDYWHIYFLDTSKRPIEHLKYIINKTYRQKIEQATYKGFNSVFDEKYNMYVGVSKDHAATILDWTDCDIIALNNTKWLYINGSDYRRILKIVCFEFQMPFVQKFFGNDDNIEYYQYNSEKILGTEDTR